MARTGKSKQKIPQSIPGSKKSAGTSQAQKQPGPTRVSGLPGSPVGTVADKKKTKRKS